MCGIAGFFGPEPAPPEYQSILERMNRALAHRGPDGQGIYCRDGIGLAHSRLAIVDLVGGAQPFVSEDGETVVVLNGEIYNHDELRHELVQQGRVFRTRSDTEVLLQLYQSLGERCIDRLRGMFAFAVWDRRERRLWLARDRIGIKPLYYFWNGALFVFGSELKAILAHPSVPRAVDEAALDEYFTFGYVPSPRTILSGIRKLEAGHTLTVTSQGITRKQYWDLDFTPSRQRPRTTEGELRHALHGAVTSHLGADVPLGSLLSGGLDSTAVLAFMAADAGKGIQTFTATFPGTKDEDRAHAVLAARRYGAAPCEIEIPEPSREALDLLAWHFDEPFADPSSVPTYLLCEGARKHVTVCLSGDGGDETFGGYRRYRTNEARNAVRRVISGRNAPELLAAAGRLAPAGSWIPRPLRLKPLLLNASESHRAAYLGEMSISAPGSKDLVYAEGLKRALVGHDPYEALNRHFDRASDWDTTSQMQYADFKTYLADGILTKVDRASMAHGLEVRVPLLDHVLVEFAALLRPSSKVAWGSGKRLMKRSLRGMVPARILARGKRGFTPPVSRWLDGTLGALLEERVLGRDSFVSAYLDIGAVRRIRDAQRAGARRDTQLLWAILTLECWGRRLL